VAAVFDLDADAAVELWWEGMNIDSILVCGVLALARWIPIFEFGVRGIGCTTHRLIRVASVHMRYDYGITAGMHGCYQHIMGKGMNQRYVHECTYVDYR